ncbi:hypothetical protein Tco_0083987 [Tanacetum coccineum]
MPRGRPPYSAGGPPISYGDRQEIWNAVRTGSEHDLHTLIRSCSACFVLCFTYAVHSEKIQSCLVMAKRNGMRESYVLYDHVMTPLTAQLEQKPKKDRGMRRGVITLHSSSAFDPNHPHLILNDDDEYGNDEGTSVQALLPH